MTQLVILTTAITRPELHRETFKTYKAFLSNSPSVDNIHWFINIDSPPYGTASASETEAAIRETLVDGGTDDLPAMNLHFHHSDKPNFLNSVLLLLKWSKNYLSDNTIVLWLEDDWLLQKDVTVGYFIDTFVKPTAVVSLVYNMYGSFPPFLMGNKITKIFYDRYLSVRAPSGNPETLSRKLMRGFAKEHGIIYFNHIHDLNYLAGKKRATLVTLGLIYEETYLKIEDCRYISNANLSDYQDLVTDKMIFVRFGTTETNKKYRDSFFRDLGRPWKKDLDLKRAAEAEAKKAAVTTIVV
jgi:hypothetical protein